MIITTQTAQGFALLLLSSFVAGILMSMLYLFLTAIPSIAVSFKAASNGYRKFNECVMSQKESPVFMASADFLICIISACAISSLTFIFYGGQFRFASVPTLCLGFFWSKLLLARSFRSLVTIISFVMIKTVLIVTYPIVLLLRLFCRSVGRIIAKSASRRRLSVMKKYTKEQLDKLEVLTEFGLIEQSYKELIK